MNKFEVQFNPKECKYYLDAYDVIFVDDQHELRFCRYCKPMAANISGKYHMVVKDNNQIFDYITRDRALCFYDRDRHRWCSKVSDHRYKCWQVIRPDDDIFINVLVGIALDEIFGSKTCSSVDDITHRIKCRFGNWYEEYTLQRHSWDSRNTIKVPDNFFDKDKYVSPQVKKTINKVYNSHLEVAYPLPIVKFVQFNGDYTTVVWQDGTHTTVKRAEGECYDEEKAIMFATIKRMCKNNGCAMARYFDSFYKHSCDISNDKEKKNGSNKKANTKGNSGKA